jgi:hypothetical protein
VLGPTRVVVPTRDFANGVAWLELSASLDTMPARVDTPDVRFRLSGRVRSRRFYLCAAIINFEGAAPSPSKGNTKATRHQE